MALRAMVEWQGRTSLVVLEGGRAGVKWTWARLLAVAAVEEELGCIVDISSRQSSRGWGDLSPSFEKPKTMGSMTSARKYLNQT